MKYNEIKKYWDERAKKNRDSLHATTDDIYLRQIELNKIKQYISEYNNIKSLKIADFGCGDGYTICDLVRLDKKNNYFGYDYSHEMIKNAVKRKEKDNLTNISFNEFDIIKDEMSEKFDVIYTIRCLINLPERELQLTALKKIKSFLKKDGIYIMIENFQEGHNNFNKLREKFELPLINIRWHNLFLTKDFLYKDIKNIFNISKIENISSLYYIISRIIYSKICKITGSGIDYYDLHHKLASELPSLGDYGPVSLVILKKN